MLALLWFTSSRTVMGTRVNGRMLASVALLAALLVLSLNSVLLVQAF
jgi:Mn2+/Fe2+ NRAMP family transporter